MNFWIFSLLPLAVAILSWVAPLALQRILPVLWGLTPLTCLTLVLMQLPAIQGSRALQQVFDWIPSLNLKGSFVLDGLSLLFLVLIFGIGFLILIYTVGYFKKEKRRPEFAATLLFFMAAMAGAVLSDNVILLFVFWELTSLASFLLIGFKHEKPEARASALQALLVTGAGGLALLVGLLLVAQICGSYEIQQWTAAKDQILSHDLFPPALILIFIGAFTKSAQFPFHFWLPNAMVAPTPVSAYLHSATMVKLGIYLLARLAPAFSSSPLWSSILVPVGTATALFAAVVALQKVDMKKLLAYSTVSSLGILIALLGISTAESYQAAVVYLFVHSLYKGALFMVTGAVDHQTGSRDVVRLEGLAQFMPVTALIAFLAALSMAGFPPLLGFIGKELLYMAKFDSDEVQGVMAGLSMVANMVMVAIALMVGLEPFFGRRPSGSPVGREASPFLLFGPLVLSVAGLLFALFPGLVVEPVLSVALSTISGESQQLKIALWHGWNIVLALSLLTLAGGVVIFLFRHRLRGWFERWSLPDWWSLQRVYEKSLTGLLQVAGWQTRLLQSGSLSRYVALSLLATLSLLIWVLVPHGLVWLEFPAEGGLKMSVGISILLALIVITAFTVVRTPSSILAAAGVGFIGFAIALFYAFYSAPDLALTQILVETLSVILVLFLISSLPRKTSPPSHIGPWQVGLSVGMGLVMAVMALVGMQAQKGRSSISVYFSENSYLLAQGKNIVNVILVDFRALDTLGEITVLAIAALGVVSLLRREKA